MSSTTPGSGIAEELKGHRRGLSAGSLQSLSRQSEVPQDAVTTAGSSRQAMTLIGPVQAGQTITSMANTRFNKAAQSSRYVDQGAAAFVEER